MSSVAVAVSVFAGGFALGTQHAALGPTVIHNPVGQHHWSFTERLFAAADPAVVSIVVPDGGSGTGFFYRPDRIVTNAHVVSSSPDAVKSISLDKDFSVDVRLSDGRIRVGKVLHVDSRIDLAVIEVEDGLGVAPLAFATSTRPRPGQPVAVIGNPFGQGQSISVGVISGVARNSTFAASDVQNLLLQTDAAVNPGNSGGPLLDASGAVLGVVTLRPDEADGRNTEGLAFALPANQVVAALDALERDGEVSYPLLGLKLRDANGDDPVRVGAFVESVTEKSGAAEAGMRADDVVTALDGQGVAGSADVIDALVDRKAGDTVTLDVTREGKSLRVRVFLGER